MRRATVRTAPSISASGLATRHSGVGRQVWLKPFWFKTILFSRIRPLLFVFCQWQDRVSHYFFFQWSSWFGKATKIPPAPTSVSSRVLLNGGRLQRRSETVQVRQSHIPFQRILNVVQFHQTAFRWPRRRRWTPSTKQGKEQVCLRLAFGWIRVPSS